MSPSAKGLQSYRIYLVEYIKKKEKLIQACHGQDYVNTSMLMVFCTESKSIRKEMGIRGERLLSVQDATIAASYAQLTATALGLSSVWIGNFNENQAAKIIRTKLHPVVLLPVGYEIKSYKKHAAPKKKKIQELMIKA